MSISAKRFAFLDAETNVGLTDFYDMADTDPRNLAPVEITDAMAQLDGFLKQADIGAAKDLLKKVADSALGTSRITKDFFSAKLDLSNVVKTGLDSLAKSMFGGNQEMMGISRQLAEGCQRYMLSGLGARKKSKKLLDCGNSKRHDRGTPCDLNLFGDLLSKIGGVDFKITTIDKNAIEKMLSGIGIQGYDIGLCNIWGAVTNGVKDVGILGRVAGNVLGRMADNSDMMAVRDIGRALQDGVNVTASVPGIAAKIMSGFKIPSEITESGLGGFGESFDLFMNKIDPKWTTSEDGWPSVENFSLDTITDSGKMFGAMCMDKDFSVDNIMGMAEDVVDWGDNDYLFAGAQMLEEASPNEDLDMYGVQKDFGYVARGIFFDED